MSCLKVDHLCKTFKRREGGKVKEIKAVDDVSLHVHVGESMAVIGTSGCGKTTLLNLILGLIKPDSGTVHKQTPIGLVGQDPYASLCPTMTAEAIIAEPLKFLKEFRGYQDTEKAVAEAMDFVNLPKDIYGKRLPSQLSGGERQRIGIARALIIKPTLLLLDEPTSMLDNEVKMDVAKIIKEVAAMHNTAFLMVTHDIMLAGDICDDMMVMSSGKIIEKNKSKEILSNPQMPLTKDLISISTDLEKYWQEKYSI